MKPSKWWLVYYIVIYGIGLAACGHMIYQSWTDPGCYWVIDGRWYYVP